MLMVVSSNKRQSNHKQQLADGALTKQQRMEDKDIHTTEGRASRKRRKERNERCKNERKWARKEEEGANQQANQEGEREREIYIYAVGSITWPPEVNNLATFFYYFLFFASFCRENEIKKKKQVLTKKRENCRVNNLATFLGKILAKKVAKLLTLRWPSYWPYFLTKKANNQHLKIIKKPYFYPFFEQQAKKQQNSKKKAITLAHATITCLVRIPGSTSTFLGVFFGLCLT